MSELFYTIFGTGSNNDFKDKLCITILGCDYFSKVADKFLNQLISFDMSCVNQ